MMNVEELLERPYHVVDILPMQVPADSGGQYFKIEQYYLDNMGRLSRRYADMLLRLNCYYDMSFSHDAEHWLQNPEPERMVQMVADSMSGETPAFYLYILLAGSTMLLTLQRETTYMTVYNANDEHLQLLASLASAEGLFLWKP